MEKHQLFIMRHGQAVTGMHDADFERNLTTHGQLQAQAMGDWLANKDMCPQKIIASAAHRARHTAELLSDQLTPAPSISIQASLYQVKVPELVALVKQQSEKCASLVLVAHNPTLEAFLYSLVTEFPIHQLQLQPGSLAEIQINSAWNQLAQNSCTLTQLIHADDLL